VAYADGNKSGGRVKGTPNRATKSLKTFLARVFDKTFADPEFEAQLLIRIKTFELDPSLLRLLLAYHAGVPTKPVEHRGTVSLAAIIAGTATEAELEDDEAA
jgi:hypothetical protein